jgi:phosphoribosylformylglycinamidine synthase
VTGLPDAWRVEVARLPSVDDPAGRLALTEVRELGIESVEEVRTQRGYLFSPGLRREQVELICAELLCDPVLESASLTAPRATPARAVAHRLLVMRRPGVMDPVALTIERALDRTGMARLDDGTTARVLTFAVYELTGSPARAELETIGRRLFANLVIEELLIDDEALHFELPGEAAAREGARIPIRDADDAALERLSREGSLSLDLVEMRAVQSHFLTEGREPTLAELETIAQTWSEHCKHKTFTGVIEFDGPAGVERIDSLLKETIVAATRELDRDWCVSVFHDNAGIVHFEGDWDVCFKVETHNHPSAIDPYGGAGTGIGGVIRDVLGVGLGAKPIANTDAFFVGPLELPDSEVPAGCMHPRRILRGVVAGVRDYGNRMGIPTVNGGVWVDRRYIGNPLVYAGTVGLMPRSAATKSVAPGDVIVVVGGRTGRDGIHGATFSSIELSDQSTVTSSAAVQIGDPICEKRVHDGLLRARDRGLYRGITDCGAGGLSSAVGEMGEDCGARVELERVPLKYPGLSAAEIWISEAQERMVLAVPADKLDECLAVFAAEDVEATAIGEFTDSGRLELSFEQREIASLDMRFLHKGNPRPVRNAVWKAPAHTDPGCPAPPAGDWRAVLLALLGAPDVASKEWILRQYDHEVQGTSVIKPLVGTRNDGPGDGCVLQPLQDSRRGLALGCGANPRQGLLDPWAMASASIDEALRNVVCVGGDPERTAILDNFSWGNCDRPEELGALVQAARACRDTALAFGTPFISGKDSLNNEYRVGSETIVIPPTLFISALAPVPDVARSVSMDLKAAGNRVYALGRTRAELGASHYLRHLGHETGGRVPRPDLERAPRTLRALHAAIAAGEVRACHDLSEGGLAVAAAEMAFAGDLGLELDLAALPFDPGDGGGADYDTDATKLFSESCTRFLVEVEPGCAAAFEARMRDLDCEALGAVRAEPRLRILGAGGQPRIDLALDELRRAHQGGFAG